MAIGGNNVRRAVAAVSNCATGTLYYNVSITFSSDPVANSYITTRL